ncbi:MAG TPA: hypothetical protein VGL70_05795 [Candidatus Binatia bacterium]|jgi:hypothetical protein
MKICENRLIFFLVIASLGILLGGCTSFVRVSPEWVIGTPACDTRLAVYSRSYFQARYQAQVFASTFLAGSIFAVAAMSQSQDVDRSKQRLKTGPFEQLLGDFDVLAYVTQEAKTVLSQSRPFAIKLSEDPTATSRIITEVRSREAPTTVRTTAPEGASQHCIGAIKVTYGLGARTGFEQIGFRKSYRPFIHVVGAIHRADGERVFWRDAVIAFGPVRYLGSGADADQIQSKELIEGLQTAARDALGLLVKSLNGDPITERAMLVDGSDSDLAL